MRITFGIDPGLTRCGFAVLVDGKLQEVGVSATDKDLPQEKRLHLHYTTLGKVFEKWTSKRFSEPQILLAIERPFLTEHNPDTGLGTAQVAGIAMMLAAAHDINVETFTPAQVKAAVTGSGTADKTQIQSAVKKILQLKHTPKPADAADAVAIALAGSLKFSSVGVGASVIHNKSQKTAGNTSGNTPQSKATTEAQRIWLDAQRNAKRVGARKM